MKKTALAAVALVPLTLLTGCQSKADKVSENISTAADNFQIERKIVFYNVRLNEYVATFEGRCSVGAGSTFAGELAITCKTGPNAYVKHFMGASRDLTWYAVQTQSANVSDYHTKIILKPGQIIPDIDVQ